MTDQASKIDAPLPGDIVVRAARRWLGTPYEHQASCRGAGTDCLGLLRGLWRELVGREPEAVPAYTRDWSEPSRTEDLLAASARHLLPGDIADRRPGDIVLIRMVEAGVAKHVGVLARSGLSHLTLIHAYSGHGVVESPLTPTWERRTVALFRFPDRRS